MSAISGAEGSPLIGGQEPICLLVACDVRLLREILAGLFQRRALVQVVGTAASAAQALAASCELRPDVALLDMAMPESLEVVRAIAADAHGPRIVAFALGDSDVEVLACIEAGAVGYVTRDAVAEDLVAAVVSAGRGETLCSPRLVTSLCRRLATLSRSAGPSALDTQLTYREREVGLLIERGLTNKEIARHLGIELATAKNHVHNILEKLHVRRRWEAGARFRERAPCQMQPSSA